MQEHRHLQPDGFPGDQVHARIGQRNPLADVDEFQAVVVQLAHGALHRLPDHFLGPRQGNGREGEEPVRVRAAHLCHALYFLAGQAVGAESLHLEHPAGLHPVLVVDPQVVSDLLVFHAVDILPSLVRQLGDRGSEVRVTVDDHRSSLPLKTFWIFSRKTAARSSSSWNTSARVSISMAGMYSGALLPNTTRETWPLTLQKS